MYTVWVEKAQQGDREAFGQLAAHFQGMAYAVAYDLLRDAHLAEDVVQEAFIAAFADIGKLREPAAFPGWLRTIVTRQCRRAQRRKTPVLLALEETAHRSLVSPDTAEIAERHDYARTLRQAVAALGDRLRVPLQLFYFYGYSLQEISAYLDLPVSVLKKRLFDGRRKLKAALPVRNLASMFNDLDEGGTTMLHIVNGDVVGNMLKSGIVQGDVLVWREIYSAGPNFANPAGAMERALRAEALEKLLGIPAEEYTAGCREQEKKLRDFSRYDEIVLWFEYDLFDQSMLAYLLHWFDGQKLSGTKLSLLSIGEFPGITPFHGLGQLTPAQLQNLSGTWRSIGRAELKLGSALWHAYTDPNPMSMSEWLEQEKEALAASALPYAYEAFQAHLARLPALEDGLGSVERETLEAVRRGADTPLELFRRVTDALPVLGLGDLEYWSVLRGLVQGTDALLAIDGVTAGAGEDDQVDDFRQVENFLQRRVTMTTLGEQVLKGLADRVAVQGIDGWYGGVHLQGRSVPWRWDRATRMPVRM